MGIAYIYFDYQDQVHQSAVNVFSSVLRQFAQALGEISPALFSFYRRFCALQRTPDLEDLLDCVLAYASRLSSLFLILDALDACEEYQRSDVLEMLPRLSAANIKIFATGRENLDDLNCFFQSTPTIRIVADINDIHSFLTTRVNRKLSGYGNLKGKVVQKLSDQADGV